MNDAIGMTFLISFGMFVLVIAVIFVIFSINTKLNWINSNIKKSNEYLSYISNLLHKEIEKK